MAYSPTNVRDEDSYECQACAAVVITSMEKQSTLLIDVFKDLTGIKPICDDSDIVFCKNCHTTLETFQIFKSLCLHTQQIFSCRELCEGTIQLEEFIVAVEVVDVVENQTINFNEVIQDVTLFICDMCQTNFKTKQDLRIHMNKFHVKKEKNLVESKYDCNICNTKLSSLQNLKRHLATHNSVKSFKCSYCDSTFKSQQNQYYHERYVHKTGKQYICSDCGYNCYNPTAMNQHMQRHHSQIKYRCDKCPKECKTVADLKDHKLTHENLSKTIPCPECGSLFRHTKAMRTHLRSVHLAKKKYICETCAKGFVSRNGLQRHLVTHTGERKFQCKYCPHAFTQLQALNRHLTTHTGKRPFACQYCNHTFSEKFYMNKHTKTCVRRPK